MKKVKEIRPILQFLITCVIALPFIILLSIDRFTITDIQSLLDYLLRCVYKIIGGEIKNGNVISRINIRKSNRWICLYGI